ncbi:hypothetical protein SCLCIDRAFT_201642 [Scleroderma citrinum Foug A]|uniref:C2H2-type domain-containing protein n=1 Tax=Scleroderma citrinum Foug A TaxID=1036808 RepID=A0A0C3DLK2_9AGAM|nr:hypothetical protein SCLCIDRAFT_201642 [Scleroderma citrinum Foug A]
MFNKQEVNYPPVLLQSLDKKHTMGSGHKCPVCQASFTRPQSVARHMRRLHGHDRPHKCQYCRAQFRRGHHLSYHINACHANEEPTQNAAGGRRKGSAAASPATTSNQLCDQCDQSSLPCDGSDPCSQCVSRKCRCTYIKFHRQTALIGPGHQPPRSTPSTSLIMGSGHAHLNAPPMMYPQFHVLPPGSSAESPPYLRAMAWTANMGLNLLTCSLVYTT